MVIFVLKAQFYNTLWILGNFINFKSKVANLVKEYEKEKNYFFYAQIKVS